MKYIFLMILLTVSMAVISQTPCAYSFTADSIIINTPAKKELADVMEVSIKNDYRFQFIKQGSRSFLKIIVRDNLGYGQTGGLMLYSTKKQIYIKDLMLIPIDKKTAYFVFELNASYILSIREYGLSSLLFRDVAEFMIPKSDSDKLKKAAACFANTVVPKE